MAKQFYSAILNGLRNERGVHAETAIAAAGRLAGTCLLRSLKLPIDTMEPGRAVFSDLANERGPALVDLLAGVLGQMGIGVDVGRSQGAAEAAAKPQLTVAETQTRLEPTLDQIRRSHQLTHEESAHAAVIAAAMFIRDCASVLGTDAGFGIAVYGLVEGSKTVPARWVDRER